MAAFKQWEVPKYNFEEAETKIKWNRKFTKQLRNESKKVDEIISYFFPSCDEKFWRASCEKSNANKVKAMNTFCKEWFLIPKLNEGTLKEIMNPDKPAKRK